MQRPLKIPKKPTLALDTNIVQDNVPQQVIPGIFIGSIHAAFNQEALLENGISHILNASRVPATFPKQFTYLSIDIRDRDDANLLSCIPASNIFLEAGIDAGGVLVHCFGGRSRSAALVAAFLMSSRGWTLDQALDVIAAARPVAAVNKGFDRQLRAYMETNHDVYAAQQVLLRNRISALQHIRGHIINAGQKIQLQNGISNDILKEPRYGDGDCEVNMDSAVAKEILTASGQKRWRPTSGRLAAIRYDGAAGGGRTDGGEDEEEESMSRTVGGTTSGGEQSDLVNESRSGQFKDLSNMPVSEGFAPNCRLSRPGSSTVRVIPPLRGLERRYGCVSCGKSLFSLANVVHEESFFMHNSINSGSDDSKGQFRIPHSPKQSSGSQIRWSQDKEEGRTVAGQASAPISIPYPPQSRRNVDAKSFSFGDECVADSPGKSAGIESSVLSHSPDTPYFTSTSASSMPHAGRSLPLPLKTSNRPQSAEKRRWLARVSLLKADSKDSMSRPPLVPDAKAAKLAADDQGIVDVVDKGKHPYFCIEYLTWMGTDPLSGTWDEGKLECPGCGRTIGSWSWRPQDCLSASQIIIGPPIFKALRGAVQLADLPLDATPMSTPRPDTEELDPGAETNVVSESGLMNLRK